MGYTNYQYGEIVKREAFPFFAECVKALLIEEEAKGIIIKGCDGTGEPLLTKDTVGFNGSRAKGEDLETCYYSLTEKEEGRRGKGSYLRFTKTAEQPYDEAVRVTACLAHLILGLKRPSSDGDDTRNWRNDFFRARKIIKKLSA